MFIHSKKISICIAVLCFFALSFIGIFYGISPFTCCQRAILGAVVGYFVTSIVVKIINAVIASAIIDRYTNKQKEDERVG